MSTVPSHKNVRRI